MAPGAADKKLKAAARRVWSGGGDRELAEEAQALGLPPPPEAEPFILLPENADTVDAYYACQTQWQCNDYTGHLRGLDYAGCRAAVAGAGLKWREVFDGLRVIEMEVLRVMAED